MTKIPESLFESNQRETHARWNAISAALKHDEYGLRLMEIVREHAALLREVTWEIVPGYAGGSTYLVSGVSLAVYKSRISQLEKERDAIIRRFLEGGESSVGADKKNVFP